MQIPTAILPYVPVGILSLAVWATYLYTLKCGFVSDDIAGLAEYDGKLQGFEYGMLWRWVRYHIVGGNYPSRHKGPDGKEIPSGKIPARHHALSILVFNLTSILAYYALSPIVGPKLALMAVIILIVHPCTTQGVAWISGLAYPLSLIWISLQILLMQYFHAHQTLNNAIWVIPVFCIIQWLAIHAIFATTAMTWAILLFLGYWQFAVLSFIISAVMCMDEIRKIISLRVSEFKKQNMEASTVFHWRKFIVAMKTFSYYICLSIFPARMGLYHTWGFHYEKSIERADKRFLLGLSFFILFTYIFFKTDMVILKLAILWYIVFSTGFWNWITAQQFVTERYILVANLGLGILVSYLTQNYLYIYGFIVAGYLVRTWTFLPTYDNELRFYQSNHWNFEKSEVALGNLGVTYARIGLPDSAKDSWFLSTQINPDYDVPWVNIFYQYRSSGMALINNGDYAGGFNKLKEGLPFLQKALSSKVCHFPDQWKKEYSDLANAIQNPSILLQEELGRLLRLREGLRTELSKVNDQNRANEINVSIVNNDAQMDRLVEYFKFCKYVPTNPQIFNIYNSMKLTNKIIRRN